MKIAGAILFFLLITGNSFAQLIAINNVSDMEFGVVQLSANGSATATVTPEFGAQFNINGLPLLSISVTVSTANLVLSGGSGVSVGSWQIHATNSQIYTPGPNILSTATTGSISLSVLGTKTLWMGGTLTAQPSSQSGSYSGSINIQIEYN